MLSNRHIWRGTPIAPQVYYTHDPLGRLTAADYRSTSLTAGSTGESFEYEYDAVGNRLTYSGPDGSHTYTYDAANRLTSVDGVTYTWDDRGDLIHDGVYTYTYNAAGRLVRAESVTATLVYTYASTSLSAGTAGGLRVAQSVDGDVTEFAWDWASGLPELLSENGNLYLVGHETLGQWNGSAWAYTLPDALGSVRQVTDEAGAVTAAREWTPYGVEVGGAQAGLGYAGEWQDAALGLAYLRARWLDSQVGRFTRRDVWEGNYSLPQSLHAYAYVRSNPLKYADPSGYTACEMDPNSSACLYQCTSGGLSEEECRVIIRRQYGGNPPATPTTPAQPPTPEPSPLPTPSGKTAYLTFDDGPDPSLTPQIALALQSRGMQATFFLTGTDVDWERIRSVCAPEDVPTEWANVEVVKLLWASRHAIGIHGWLHTNAWNSPTVDPSQEIRLVEEALKSILGITELPDRLLRAPYGAFPDVPVSGYSGWYYYGWSVDAKDDYGVDAQTIINNVLGQLDQKGLPDNPIILLHSIRPGTYDAIVDPRYDLLGKLVEAGYTQFRKLPRPGDPVDTAIWP